MCYESGLSTYIPFLDAYYFSWYLRGVSTRLRVIDRLVSSNRQCMSFEIIKFDKRVPLRLQVQLLGATKFLTGARKIAVGSNLTSAVLLFTTTVAEYLLVNITS